MSAGRRGRGRAQKTLQLVAAAYRILEEIGPKSHDTTSGPTLESIGISKVLTVLYVGDHDPSGRHMSDIDLPERLERYGGNVEIIRVAIAEQDTTKKAAHEGLFDLECATGLPIRFAWCMLFTVADREGRFAWRPRTLKAQILPHDEIDFSRVLDAWVTRGFVRKYRVGDEWFGWIPTFTKHQVINNRALSPVLLRERIENEILARLDVNAWNHNIKIETAERQSLNEVLSRWPSISGRAPK